MASLLVALIAVLAAPAIASARAHRGILWGAWFEPQVPYTLGSVPRFERMLHKGVSIINFGLAFSDCRMTPCKVNGLPIAPLQNARSHGAIPMVSWGSQSVPFSATEPDYRLSEVANGRYDTTIRNVALGAAQWGHPFFIRFDWEMNGNWFPWGQRINGNQPGDFLAAWRHVHDIFTSVGANNVSWLWCPNTDPGHGWSPMRALYPGNSYVDWTCLDGYNWGNWGRTSPGAQRGGWKTFNQIFARSYREIRSLAPSKPIAIGEIGADARGGSRAKWIKRMLHDLPRKYPQIRALVWLQTDYSPFDFLIKRSTGSARAFRAGVKSSTYISNVFCNLSGPIRPPLAPPRKRKQRRCS